jgi:hypothetical protein
VDFFSFANSPAHPVLKIRLSLHQRQLKVLGFSRRYSRVKTEGKLTTHRVHRRLPPPPFAALGSLPWSFFFDLKITCTLFLSVVVVVAKRKSGGSRRKIGRGEIQQKVK